MEYKVYGDDIVLRLDPGDKIAESLLVLAEKENIQAASVVGLGATDDVKFGIMDLNAKEYTEMHLKKPMEITMFMGNLTRKDGEAYLYSHINLGDVEGNVFGGHFHEGVISVTAELFIHTVGGTVERVFDEKSGVNKMVF